MRLFKRAKDAVGVVDEQLVAHGTLARGNVQDVRTTGMSRGLAEQGLGVEVVCVVTVEVIGLDGQEPYTASCHHPVPQVYLPRLQTPGAAVAVRVDPADPQHIALDLAHDVPPAPIVLVSDDGTKQTVHTNKAAYTQAEMLAQGTPCTVEIQVAFPLNQLTSTGLPATGIVMQVTRDGVPPYQAQIGIHVPDAAAAMVVPGARLPARWMPGVGAPTDVNLCTIDFPAMGIAAT